MKARWASFPSCTGVLFALSVCACAPVCRGVDGTCLELRVAGAGSYENYSIEWRYRQNEEPLAGLRRGATDQGGALPRTFRIVPPTDIPVDSVFSVGVLGISNGGQEQSAGSIELSLSADEHATHVVPLGLRVQRAEIALGSNGLDLLAVDLDGDATEDLVAVGTTENATAATNMGGLLSILYGRGDGTFSTPKTAELPTLPFSVQAKDTNADGKPDLVVSGSGPAFSFFTGLAAQQVDRTIVGNDVRPGTPPCVSGNDPHTLALGDFNGDKIVDVAATLRTGPCVSLLLGTVQTAFVPNQDASRPMPTQVGDSLSRLAAADFNQDGLLDVAVIRTAQGRGNTALLLGQAGLAGFSLFATMTAGSEPTGLVAQDLNGDGLPDLGVVSAKTSSLHIFYNRGFVNGQFGGGSGPDPVDRAADYEYRFGLPGRGPTCLVSGDINQDGVPDLALCDGALPSISVMFGRGNNGFDPPIRLQVDRTPSALVIADLDHKGQLDFAVSYQGSDKITLLLNRSG